MELIKKIDDNLLQRIDENLPSFGGNTLPQNIVKAETALQEMEPIQQIWNHSHSQWMWKHLNLEYVSPMKNMRQISAEITRKRQAFEEAKYKYLEKQVLIEKLTKKFHETTDEIEQAGLQVKISKHQHSLKEMRRLIDGALKDIMTLNDLYKQLQQRVGEVTESDVEKEESKAHLQRSIVQCIRDVRQTGSITKGEQQYLEQIGVNPSKMQRVIRGYVQEEGNGDWSTQPLFTFVNSIVDELIDIHQVDIKRMESQGFSSEFNEEFTTNPNYQLTENTNETD